jgi:hypothetical protein
VANRDFRDEIDISRIDPLTERITQINSREYRDQSSDHLLSQRKEYLKSMMGDLDRIDRITTEFQ